MKGRIKNIYNKIKKYPVTIWMVVSVLALTAVYVAYAAYNGTAEVKRVVSTQASSSTVFSSNYMEASSTSVRYLKTTNSGAYICSVTVCNYDQLDPTSPAKGMIDYSFKAELVEYDISKNSYEPVTAVKMNGQTKEIFYVQKKTDNNQPVNSDDEHDLNGGNDGETFSYTYTGESLTGGVSSKDSFDICFDAAEVVKDSPVLFIRVTAIPTEESVQLNGSGISSLTSIISISQGRTVETGWHGSLQETSTTTEYDAYNLVIEGSGSGKIDIKWDDGKFLMNPVFVEMYGNSGKGILTEASDVPSQTGWKICTLTVNSMIDNRYVIQFYKRDPKAAASGNIICNNYVATAAEKSDTEEQQENQQEP